MTKKMNKLLFLCCARRVADEMQSVSAATEEQSASAEEIASASDALAKLAQDVQTGLRKFKFKKINTTTKIKLKKELKFEFFFSSLHFNKKVLLK